jgi:chemotaxis protein CheZ
MDQATAINDMDLDALFDTAASGPASVAPAPGAASAPAPTGRTQAAGAGPIPAVAPEAGVVHVYQRVGELTRTLHNTLRDLGYYNEIEDSLSNLPDAKSRLTYIARLTGEAAEKVLNAVEVAQSEQDALAERAKAARAALLENPVKAVATGGVLDFVDAVIANTAKTNATLTDIMMAQDFHDLTGQVIRKVVSLAGNMETQLVKLLVEVTPPEQRQKIKQDEKLGGPVVNPEVRADVVKGQGDVDDLLASLGF